MKPWAARFLSSILAASLLLSTPILRAEDPKPGASCENELEDMGASKQEVMEKLNKLPPLTLDYPSVREAIRNLIREIKELHPDFQGLSEMEQGLLDGALTPDQAHALASQLQNKLVREADKLLESGKLNDHQRKIAEGYRLLIQRTENLKKRAEHYKENPEDLKKDQEKQKQKEEERKEREKAEQDKKDGKEQNKDQQGKDGKDQDQKDKQDKDSDHESEQDSKDQQDKDGKDNKDKQNQDQKKGDKQKDKKQDGQKDDQNKDQQDQQDQESEQDSKDQQDKDGKESKDKKDQQQKDKKKGDKQKDKKQDGQKDDQDKDQQDKDGQDQESDQDSQDQKDKDGKESKDKQGQEQKDKQKGDKQKGDKQKGDQKDKGQEGKDGDQESDQDGQDGKKEGQQGKDGKDGKDQQGKDPSNKSGKQDGNQELADKLSEYLKDRLKKDAEKNKDKDKKDADAKQKAEDQKSKDKDSKIEPSKDNKPKTREEIKKEQEAEAEKQKQNEKAREKIEKDKNTKPVTMNDLQKSEALKGYLDNLWADTLRQYYNHARLLSALSHFQDVTRDLLSSKYGSLDFIKQYSARAAALQESLEISKVSYKNLEDLGLSMLGGDEDRKPEVMRKLRYLDDVLTELKRASPLTAEESAALEYVKYLLAAAEGKKGTGSEIDLGKAFYEQLLGPISKKIIREKYTSTNGDVDWKKLADDLKRGSLNDLLVMGRLRQYMDVLLKQTMQPKDKKYFNGDKVPINEAEPDLELAQEMDRQPYFYRDGAPPSEDFLKVISGDQLENTYHDEVIKHDPLTPQPKKVTIILYDVSGSMGGNSRWLLRNSLIAGYIDSVNKEVAARRASHVVYAIPFDNTPHSPERISDLKEAEAFFQRLRNQYQKDGGGTEITGALSKVYELIAKHQKEGGELDRANILFITDGEDNINFDAVKKAREKVDPKVEIVLNAITLGGHNADLEKFIMAQGEGHESSLGRVYHRHISDTDTANIMDANTRLKSIDEKSKDYDPATDKLFSLQALVQLKQRLANLALQKNLSDEAGGGLELKELQRALTSSGSQTSGQLEELANFYLKAVRGPIGAGWSEGQRANSLNRFFTELAKVLHEDIGTVISQIGPDAKKNLLKWLEQK